MRSTCRHGLLYDFREVIRIWRFDLPKGIIVVVWGVLSATSCPPTGQGYANNDLVKVS